MDNETHTKQISVKVYHALTLLADYHEYRRRTDETEKLLSGRIEAMDSDEYKDFITEKHRLSIGGK